MNGSQGSQCFPTSIEMGISRGFWEKGGSPDYQNNLHRKQRCDQHKMNKTNTKSKQQECKAIMKNGEKCTRLALIDGFCTIHFKMSRGCNKINK